MTNVNANEWLRSRLDLDCHDLVKSLVLGLATTQGLQVSDVRCSERDGDVVHARFSALAEAGPALEAVGLVGIEASEEEGVVASATMIPFLGGRRVTAVGFRQGTLEWECRLVEGEPSWTSFGWLEDADLEYASIRAPADILIGAPEQEIL